MIVGASGDTGNGRGDLTGALYLFSFDGQFTSNLSLSGVLGGAYANGPTSSLTAQGINRMPVENIGNASRSMASCSPSGRPSMAAVRACCRLPARSI